MKVAFLLYEGVEPIDLAALGVLSMAKRIVPSISFQAIAETNAPVRMANGLDVLPAATFEGAADCDLLVIPGGPGWRQAASRPVVQAFLRQAARKATLCSVCTGAMLLAEAGLLSGLTATTKAQTVAPERPPIDELAERFKDVNVTSALIVDNGAVMTGGGVSLCIDAMLYVLEQRFGPEVRGEVARTIEYAAAYEANRQRLAIVRP